MTLAGSSKSGIVGVILAGGRSSRMGGADKALMPLADTTMIDAIIERLAPQVDQIVINARDITAHLHPDLPQIRDAFGSFAGPLSGILAGMKWTQANHPDASSIVSVACDTPFIPSDLVHRLVTAAIQHRRSATLPASVNLAGSEKDERPDTIVLAGSAGRTHPVCGLWPVRLADVLEVSLAAGERKVLTWAVEHGAITVDFPLIEVSGEMIDPFFNVNIADDLQKANRIKTLLE